MFAKLKQTLYLTRGERSFVIAYAAVIAMSAGIAVMIMSEVEGGVAMAAGGLQAYWIIFSGALAGGVAMFAARGWLGNPKALGLARAVIGCLVVAFLASVVAGTMIRPLYGTFYAPVLLVDALLSKPWLAGAWFGVLMGAHYLMYQFREEQSLGLGRGAPRRASAELSQLSQANLYRRSYRG